MTECGCEQQGGTPREIVNPPGLTQISRRIGSHADFLATMRAALGRELDPGVAPLRRLADRIPEDFIVALLDAWAGVGDVLTFYQERIANETYRRTATERFSLFELARLIGYRPRPGLAASTVLSFTVDDFPQTPPVRTVLSAGLQVQSIPEGGRQPQLFETLETILARTEWNSLQPLRAQPARLTANSPRVEVTADSAVAPGDPVLIVPADGSPRFATVVTVRPVPGRPAVTLDLVDPPTAAPPFQVPDLPAGSTADVPGIELDGTALGAITGRSWTAADISGLCLRKGWNEQELEDAINSRPPATGSTRLFALRQRASIFGHNAPLWTSLPAALRHITRVEIKSGTGYALTDIPPAYENDWESGALGSGGTTDADRTIYLDNVYPAVVPGGWVVLISPGVVPLAARVKSVISTTRTQFAISGATSQLVLDRGDLSKFKMRNTTVLVRSESLTLAPSPVDEDVSGARIVLERAFLGLQSGRDIVVSGEQADRPGVVEPVVCELAEAFLIGGLTVLQLTNPLPHPYRRAGLQIDANVARAGHGQTTVEVLGNGDAGTPFQQFSLSGPPLTYVGSDNATGAASTLAVFVNDVRWTEVPQLYGCGATDRVYTTWTDDQSRTQVQFGDGLTGARPPTGSANIRAVYRRGLGLAGLVSAGSLSMLMSRPLGLSAVRNPLAPIGATDSEGADEMRANLPLGIVTLNRIVSLRDYEDFSRAFAGVRKAIAVDGWDSGHRVVFVTVAGPQGAAIPAESPVHTNLLSALKRYGDPYRRVVVASHRPALFRIEATLVRDPAQPADAVTSRVRAELLAAFGFEARDFGRPVALSEVVEVIQRVDGVVAVDVDELYRTDDPPTLHPEPLLPAQLPTPGLAAELLTIDPAGITVR